MNNMAIFTPNEQKLLKFLAEDPELAHKPTQLSQLMGWKRRGTSREAIMRVKKKLKDLQEANNFLQELGITPEDAEDW